MAMKHDPLVPPDPEEWLEADEMERLESIIELHRRLGHELPNERLHAAIHMVVENQVALGDETPVAGVLRRLLDEGLDRHDAVHAIGEIVSGHLWQIMGGDGSPGPFDEEAYAREIAALTARGWLEKHGVDPD